MNTAIEGLWIVTQKRHIRQASYERRRVQSVQRY